MMKKYFLVWSCLLLFTGGNQILAADTGTADHLVSILNYLLMNEKATRQYPADTSFVAVGTVADVACPGYLSSIIGPAFGNRITRLSDDPDVQVNFPYPKTPSWNSDSSLLMLTNRLLDGRTYELIAANAWWGDDEKKWSALAPHIYYAMEHTYDLDGDGRDDHVLVKRDVTPTLATGSEPAKERLVTFSVQITTRFCWASMKATSTTRTGLWCLRRAGKINLT